MLASPTFTNLEILISKFKKKDTERIASEASCYLRAPGRMYPPLCRSSSGRHVWVLCQGRLPSPRAWHRWCQRSLLPQLHASETSCPGPSSHLNTGTQRDKKKKLKNIFKKCSEMMCVCDLQLRNLCFYKGKWRHFLHQCEGRTHISHTGHAVTVSHAAGVLTSTENTTSILSTIVFLSSLPLPGGEVWARTSPHPCNV